MERVVFEDGKFAQLCQLGELNTVPYCVYYLVENFSKFPLFQFNL